MPFFLNEGLIRWVVIIAGRWQNRLRTGVVASFVPSIIFHSRSDNGRLRRNPLCCSCVSEKMPVTMLTPVAKGGSFVRVHWSTGSSFVMRANHRAIIIGASHTQGVSNGISIAPTPGWQSGNDVLFDSASNAAFLTLGYWLRTWWAFRARYCLGSILRRDYTTDRVLQRHACTYRLYGLSWLCLPGPLCGTDSSIAAPTIRVCCNNNQANWRAFSFALLETPFFGSIGVFIPFISRHLCFRRPKRHAVQSKTTPVHTTLDAKVSPYLPSWALCFHLCLLFLECRDWAPRKKSTCHYLETI